MVYFILSILIISLVLYIVLAGADLGAGILEVFKAKDHKRVQERVITDAMGPVWEANHIWIILVIVILFVGFPLAFKTLSIFLHIPISMVLVGIMVRGSAFTFRHYDAVKDRTSQTLYSKFFAYSSVWTTFWIGVTVGALIQGDIPAQGNTLGFYENYIAPWWAPFPVILGIFLNGLFAYEASTFIIGECEQEEIRKIFVRQSWRTNIISIVFGAITLGYGLLTDIPSLRHLFANKYTITLFVISGFLNYFQWVCIKKRMNNWLRVVGGCQLTLIFSAWLVGQYPYLYYNDKLKYGVDMVKSVAPESVQKQLTIALVIGVLVIFPPYLYLMKIFKGRPNHAD